MRLNESHKWPQAKSGTERDHRAIVLRRIDGALVVSSGYAKYGQRFSPAAYDPTETIGLLVEGGKECQETVGLQSNSSSVLASVASGNAPSRLQSTSPELTQRPAARKTQVSSP